MQYGACEADIKKLNARKRERKQDIRRRLAENADRYLELETIVASRKNAGVRITTGGTADSTDGLLRAITPLDYVGAQVAKDRRKRDGVRHTKEILTDVKSKEIDPIEAMILRKGLMG